MGCNCKNSNIENQKPETKNKIVNNILNFFVFIIVFIIAVPIVIPFIAYVLFKTIVLKNGETNMTSLFLKFAKKLIEKDDDEDDEEDDEEGELYEDDYELTDYDEVNNEKTQKVNV